MAGDRRDTGHGNPDGIERRKTGRLRCSGLACSLGEVTDLCASGMRVRSTRPLALPAGTSVTLTADDLSLTVRARVAWARQVGRKSYEAGVEFLNLDGDQRKMLAEIARSSSAAFAAMFYTNAA